MPITSAHPAIIFSFLGKSNTRLSMTGVIVGSIIPDFEYFFRMTFLSLYSHTIPGLFWFDLPIGLFIYFLFHCAIKKPLLDNISPWFKYRLLNTYNLNGLDYFKKKWLTVIISILIGAASHILWDEFTHAKGYFVSLIPILAVQLDFQNYSMYIYRLFQHFSSLIGSLFVMYVILKLPFDKENSKMKYHKVNYLFWITYFLFVAFLLIIRLSFFSEISTMGDYFSHNDFSISVLSSFILGIIPTSIVWSLLFKSKYLKNIY